MNKACFQHDMAYRDFKDLARRTAADKVLRDKDLILLKIELAEELHKPGFRKFKKRRVYSSIHHLKTIFGVLI